MVPLMLRFPPARGAPRVSPIHLCPPARTWVVCGAAHL